MANRNAASDIDCTKDPIASLKTMFVDMTSGPRIASGQTPAKRPVFLKPHGVAHGTFEVKADIPADLKIGFFAEPRTYPAWLRISSDTVPFRPDLKTTVGIGMKLFGVPGSKLIGNPEDRTHDIVLQNHDVFFVDNAFEMCAFTKAGVDGTFAGYLAAHPETDRILKEMEKRVPSALGISYWSCLPFSLGADLYVKYKLEPEVPIAPAPELNSDDPNYLSVDMRDRLRLAECRFRFLVQLRTNAATMPLDAATVRWSETESVPIEVGTLVLPMQDIESRGQREYGENLAMNPWRVAEAHRPQGSISDVRKVVYEASAELRRNVNGVPDGEPLRPRPAETYPLARDTVIVAAKIHPSIGIARVGNSKDFFIGPEVNDPPQVEAGMRRDGSGALKRQAARFRVFGYNAAGEVISELTSDNALIEWQVEMANLKSAWYQFKIALDIPEFASEGPTSRRNAGVGDRSKLSIHGGQRRVSGPNRSGAGFAFDSGKFNDQSVYLGELQTDDKGRLIVLGGFGVAGSVPGAAITDFANNDGWYDDVGDGPVTAKISIGGRDLPVDPAWVVVTPPNYAPDLKSVRTLYDLLQDVFTEAGWLAPQEDVSFTRDVLPIFKRLAGLQWVNAGYASYFGHGAPFDFNNPAVLASLADNTDRNKARRYQVENSFRNFSKDGASPEPWPWIYGDAMEIPFAQTPRQNTMLARTQLLCLKRWAEGSFNSDFNPASVPPKTIEEVPLTERPAMLDRAALEFCLADAFHPGCEMTWPMRHASLYMAPFRIRHRRPDEKLYPIGDELTPEKALAFDGILFGQSPGWITRWMAVPWHTDTASCRSQADYDRTYNPFVPTFWPARVPNQIVSQSSYEIAKDTSKPREERVAAFRNRDDWIAATLDVRLGYIEEITQMITRFGDMGLVEARKGVEGDPEISSVIYVSDGRKVAPVSTDVAGVAERVVSTPGFTGQIGQFPFGRRNE